MRQYYLYILKCADGSYYTGVTNNLELRFAEHQNGLIDKCYTYQRRPLELVYSQEFQDIRDALEREKQVKGWSHRKKEALISGDFERLVGLSKSHPSTGSG